MTLFLVAIVVLASGLLGTLVVRYRRRGRNPNASCYRIGNDPTDIHRQAIKRTFADLDGVAPHEVDVSWSKDGDNMKRGIPQTVRRGCDAPACRRVEGWGSVRGDLRPLGRNLSRHRFGSAIDPRLYSHRVSLAHWRRSASFTIVFSSIEAASPWRLGPCSSWRRISFHRLPRRSRLCPAPGAIRPFSGSPGNNPVLDRPRECGDRP
jgi:hypothetical protein